MQAVTMQRALMKPAEHPGQLAQFGSSELLNKQTIPDFSSFLSSPPVHKLWVQLVHSTASRLCGEEKAVQVDEALQMGVLCKSTHSLA